MTDEKKPAHKNVFVALAAAQMEFGAVTKGSTNPAFKSKYADLADVAAVVIPALASHGVAVMHYMTGENLDRMRTEFVHGESDTRIACDVPLLVDRQNMQGMKSATTYAKRIGLESLSGVAPEDDDGNAATSAPPKAESQKPRQQQGPSAAQIAADSIGNADSIDQLQGIWEGLPRSVRGEPSVVASKDAAKARLTQKPQFDDSIPY